MKMLKNRQSPELRRTVRVGVKIWNMMMMMMMMMMAANSVGWAEDREDDDDDG